MGDKLKRAGWMSLALLFLATGVGFGLYAVWAGSNDSKNNDTQQSQTAKLEGTKLQDFQPVAKVDKLIIKDIQKGKGSAVKSDSTITVHYTGAVASTGVIFQSSIDTGQPITTKLDGVIKGWQGLIGMKEGGTRRLIIPASLAYGSSAQPGIPANSDLVFDVFLVSVK